MTSEKDQLRANTSGNCRPRVLVLFGTNNISGPGKGLFQLLGHPLSKAYEFTICNFRHPRQNTFEFLEEAQARNLDIKLITQRWALDVLMIRDAVRIAREGHYQIIQSHGYKSHLIAGMISITLGIPWIGVVHGWTDESWKMCIYNRLDKFVLRYPTTVITVSPKLQKTMSKIRISRRTKMILNGVEASHSAGGQVDQNFRNEFLRNTTDVLVVVIGRLSREKGQDQFLRSLSLISEKTVRAVIIGDGPERESLVKISHDLGLDDRVTFVGYSSEIQKFYHAADIVALPSRSEGLPNVILEAQCFGKPVVAFDVGGVCELIDDRKTGWLAAPGDTEGFASALSRAAESAEERGKVAARALACLFPKFSVERRVDKILAEYQRLLPTKVEGPIESNDAKVRI